MLLIKLQNIIQFHYSKLKNVSSINFLLEVNDKYIFK